MKKNVSLFFLSFTIFFQWGCSSKKSIAQKLIDQETGQILAQHKLALNAFANKDLDTSCKLFTQLASDEKNPIRKVSQLRQQLACPQLINSIANEATPWLLPLNIDVKIKRAEINKSELDLAVALKEKAAASNRVREKLDLLQRALSLSNGNPTLKTEIQDKIYLLSPRLLPEPTPKDYYKVALDLLHNREFEKARLYLKKIIDAKIPASGFTIEEQIQARKFYRNSFKVEQKKDVFLTEAQSYQQWLQKKFAQKKLSDYKILSESYMSLGRATWTAGEAGAAEKIFLGAIKQLQGKSPTDEFNWILGRMQEERGEWQKAIDFYDRALTNLTDGKPASNSIEKNPIFEKLLFSKAWMLSRLQKYKDSAALFARLREQTKDPFDMARYTYWLGKNLRAGGFVADAKVEFDRLKFSDNLGYYGLLSYYELNEDLPALASNASENDSQDNFVNQGLRALPIAEQNTIAWLLLAGENILLEKFLSQKTTDLKSMNDEKVLAYLKAYAAGGLYLPLFTQLGNLEGNVKSEILQKHPELLFPRSYGEIVKQAADKFSVKQELIYSIIRQESAFNPFARSAADAFGLMQVLPTVAQHESRKTGIKLNEHEDLFDPTINIQTGTALLSELQTKYRGKIILMAAAYNANEMAIANWLKTRFRDSTIEFIEDIPYDETRSYVKLVLRNFIFYSRLQNAGHSIPFPRQCLDNLQSLSESTDMAPH